MSTNETLKMLYNECLKLDLNEATQLILEAETEEEQEFYSIVSDFVIQLGSLIYYDIGCI